MNSFLKRFTPKPCCRGEGDPADRVPHPGHPVDRQPGGGRAQGGAGEGEGEEVQAQLWVLYYFHLFWRKISFFPFTWHTPGSHLQIVAEQVPPPSPPAAAFRSAVEEK